LSQFKLFNLSNNHALEENYPITLSKEKKHVKSAFLVAALLNQVVLSRQLTLTNFDPHSFLNSKIFHWKKFPSVMILMIGLLFCFPQGNQVKASTRPD